MCSATFSMLSERYDHINRWTPIFGTCTTEYVLCWLDPQQNAKTTRNINSYSWDGTTGLPRRFWKGTHTILQRQFPSSHVSFDLVGRIAYVMEVLLWLNQITGRDYFSEWLCLSRTDSDEVSGKIAVVATGGEAQVLSAAGTSVLVSVDSLRWCVYPTSGITQGLCAVSTANLRTFDSILIDLGKYH